MVTNCISCIIVNEDFHQIGNDLPVSGTLVCIQITIKDAATGVRTVSKNVYNIETNNRRVFVVRTVVGIHDGMDETIQQYRYEDIAIVINIGVQPIKQKNGCVVVHMEK